MSTALKKSKKPSKTLVLKFNETAKREPPVETPLLVVRKPYFLHPARSYDVVLYRAMGNAVDSFRRGTGTSGVFVSEHGFINKAECPLWMELGQVPEIPA